MRVNYDPIPECACGGTGTLRFSPELPLSLIPCMDCVARYDANHCYYCSARHKEKTYPVPNSTRRCCAACAHKAKESFIKELDRVFDLLDKVDDCLREFSDIS